MTLRKRGKHGGKANILFKYLRIQGKQKVLEEKMAEDLSNYIENFVDERSLINIEPDACKTFILR